MLPSGLRRGVIVCSLLVPLWVQAAPSTDSSAGKIFVDYFPKSNMIRVEASDAALRDLVEEMANQAGFRLLGPTPPEITVSIRKMNRLDRMLFELLDWEGISFLFLYDNLKTGKLAEVVILGGDGPEGTSKILPVKFADRVPVYGKSDRDSGGEAPPTILEPAPQGNPVPELLRMADSDDPKARSAALEKLAPHWGEDESAATRIRDSLHDPDPRVRSTAAELLGSLLAHFPETGRVFLLALSEGSPEVRQLALLTLWDSQSPMIQDALQLAIRDENPQVRMWAERISRDLPENTDPPEPVY